MTRLSLLLTLVIASAMIVPLLGSGSKPCSGLRHITAITSLGSHEVWAYHAWDWLNVTIEYRDMTSRDREPSEGILELATRSSGKMI